MSPLPNLSHIHTTTKFCHSHAKRKFLHAKKKFPQLHAQMNSHIPNKNFPQYPKNLPIPINISMHIPTKFCHDHTTKFTHGNKFFHIYHEHIPISQAQSFHDVNTPKIQTKIHPTTSQITYIVKIPKATNIAQIAPRSKKKTHFKNAPKPTFQTWSITQCPQNFKSDNISPCNFQQNMQQHFAKQRNQRNLGVYMTIWSMGPRFLKKSIIIMPLKYWIILLTMRS